MFFVKPKFKNLRSQVYLKDKLTTAINNYKSIKNI